MAAAGPVVSVMTDARIRFAFAWLVAVGLTVGAASASAAVKTEIPLSFVVGQAKFAVAVKVESVNRQRGIIVYVHAANLKGKTRFAKFRHNLSTGEHRDADELLAAVKVGDAGVLFFTDESSLGITCFAHVGKTWYQTYAANDSEPAKVWWNFTHQERYMSLCFVGDSATLADSVKGLLAGREVEITRAAGPRDATLIQVKVCLKDDQKPVPGSPRANPGGEPPK